MKLEITKELERRLKIIKNCKVSDYLLSKPETLTINFLGVSKEDITQISFIDEARLNRYGHGKRWYSKIRYRASPGKVIRKISSDRFSDAEIESFSNKYTSFSKDKINIKIVYGKDIAFWYHGVNYARSSYSLGASCMRHTNCQKFFGIYTENPDHVGMAIILNQDNKLTARCLIWYPNTKKDKKTVFFDRIYAISEDLEKAMFASLEQKGYIPISSKNINKPADVGYISIDLPNTEFDYYPYVDTLSFLTDSGLNNQGGIELSSTDGGGEERCDGCGETDVELHSVITGGHYCEDCCVYSRHHRGYIPNDDAVWCEYTDDSYFSDDMITLYNGDECFLGYTFLLESVEGEYFIKGDDNFVQPEETNEWYYIGSRQIIKQEEKYYLNESCVE